MSKRIQEEANKKSIKPRSDHPEGAENQAKATNPIDTSEIINDVDSEIEELIGQRSEYDEMLARWHRKRFGNRQPKSFPFVGASNISMPTIDKAIKKLKPTFLNLIWQPDSVASFEAMPNVKDCDDLEDTARYNEQMLNHIVKDLMSKNFEKTNYLVDRMLQTGKCLVKVTYRYQTEEKEYEINLAEDLTAKEEEVLVNNMDKMMAEGTGERLVMEFILNIYTRMGYDINLEEQDDLKQMQKTIKQFRERISKEQLDKPIKIKVERIIAHSPEWIVVDPRNLMVNGRYNDIQEADLYCHRMWFTPNKLRQMAKNGFFDKVGTGAIEEIIKNASVDTNGSSTTSGDSGQRDDYQESVRQTTGDYWSSTNNEKLIEIREVGLYAMPDSSGITRKCIMYYAPSYKEEALKFVVLPYDDNKWAFVSFDLELNDDGWLSSRGVPSMLDYLATTIDIKHNQRNDVGTLENAPMLKYIPGQVNAQNIRYKPGQGIPVKAMDALDTLQIKTGGGQQFLQEEEYLNRQVADYISTPDTGQAQGGQPRTAEEIIATTAQNELAKSLDAKVFLNSFQELLTMTYHRWMQFGNEEYEFNVKGSPNPARSEPQTAVSEGDVDRNKWKRHKPEMFKIVPKGTLRDTNPVLRQQQVSAYRNLLQDPVLGKWFKDEEIAKFAAETITPNKAECFKRTKEEVQQIQQQAEQQQLKQLQIQMQAMAQQKQLDAQLKMQIDANKEQAETQGNILEDKFKTGNDVTRTKASTIKEIATIEAEAVVETNPDVNVR